MRIVAMSDSHGSRSALEKIFEKTRDTGDIFVHLGDGEWELGYMKQKYPQLDIRHVAGNCDCGSSSPKMLVIEAEGIKVLCTHGNLVQASCGTQTMRSVARDNGCSVVLYGHTHCRLQRFEDGIYILNPGSCAQPRDSQAPSFGWVDITQSGIFLNIADVQSLNTQF